MHLPTDAQGAVNKRFVAGNPLNGKRATVVTPADLNAYANEIANVILAAGVELDPAKEDQLVDALLTLLIRTVRTGALVTIDYAAIECDGGELDDEGNLVDDPSQQITYPVEFNQDLTIDQLKTELEFYDDIDGGTL